MPVTGATSNFQLEIFVNDNNADTIIFLNILLRDDQTFRTNLLELMDLEDLTSSGLATEELV